MKILTETGKCERLILGEPHIGEGVWIGPWTILDSVHGNLSIGDGTTICAGVKIYTHTNEDRVLKGESTKIPGYKGDVVIGKNVFIGSNTVIEPNVTIGNYVKVGANSLVRRDTRIPDGEFWAGTPARRIGDSP